MGRSKKKLKISKETHESVADASVIAPSIVSKLPSAALFEIDTKGKAAQTKTLTKAQTKAKSKANKTNEQDNAMSDVPASTSTSARKRKRTSTASTPTVASPVSAPTPAPSTTAPSKRSADWKRKSHKKGLQQDKIRNKTAKAAVAPKSSVTDLWSTPIDPLDRTGLDAPVDQKGWTVGSSKQTKFLHHSSAHSKTDVAPTPLSAVVHGGTSYNPEPTVHQELLATAYERDAAEREEKAKLRAKLNPDPEQWKEVDWDADMDEENGTHIKPVEEKRMSKAERNKQKMHLVKTAISQEKARERAMHKQIDRLPAILAEIKKTGKQSAAEAKRIAELKATQPDHHARLGKNKFEESFPEVPLTEELSGNLREVKSSVHLMSDQFKRFQQQNLIESRKKNNLHRRYALKLYNRYKDE